MSRKLRAYELADDLVVLVYEIARNFPREEIYALTSQLRKAAYSVPANIVEGCGRNTERDFLRFLDNALGSLREVGYFLHFAQRLGYLDDLAAQPVLAHHHEASRVLAGLIASLRPTHHNRL
ncbi:MAG: four helix bundle protein [Phycisphaerales bacterium]|nr:four helix bundle protein [Phycisphaerales bacterium]